jgi:glutathione S-transferase
MFILHIANKNYSSWSLRPWVLMKTLGIPFDEQLHPFNEQNNWEHYRQFSPTGTVPCLQDDHTLVWDSLGIIEYLAETYPLVWPANKVARAWARCASAEMHSGFSAIRNQCNMTVGQRVKLADISAVLAKEIRRIDELWNQGLERFGGEFLAGDHFTAVDAFYAPIAFRIRSYDLPLSDRAASYAQRLLALEAMQEWEAAALSETWRDPSHEQETLQAGEVIADYRVL